MIGLAVDVARGDCHMDIYQRCFKAGQKVLYIILSPEIQVMHFHVFRCKVDISLAPGLGLYLNELLFDRYNLKVGHENEKIMRAIKKSKGKPAGTDSTPAAEEDGSGASQIPLQVPTSPLVANHTNYNMSCVFSLCERL